ncbi:MAG: hypothetical protein PWP19_1118, partial [Thermococcaceae archaeon]|nr:hypothetical protein [Thermococcaceae archaeon]
VFIFFVTNILKLTKYVTYITTLRIDKVGNYAGVLEIKVKQ